MLWIPMVPSKKAVASRSGLRGHQSTWKAQFEAEGSSPIISDVCGFQHNARLSFPEERSRSGSCLHHESERTPFS